MTPVTRTAAASVGVVNPRPGVLRRTHGLLLTGSLRAESHTRALGEALVLDQPWLQLGPSLDRLPFYDADSDVFGPPATVSELRDRVRASALLLFVTPDYDGAVPGLVANAVDWLAHPRVTSVLRGARFLVVSANPDDQGGTTAGAALAAQLERAGGISLAPPVAVPHVDAVLASGAAIEGLAGLAARTRAAVRREARTQVAPVRARRAA